MTADLADNSREVRLVNLMTEIVGAYVSNNSVPVIQLPELMRSIHAALADTQGEKPTPAVEPAVPIKKSVQKDYIVCLEDGKRLKTLKRYLRSHHNLTPEEYRSKWGLPHDYPMVAPIYSARRSQLAKDSGLGTKPRRGDKRR